MVVALRNLLDMLASPTEVFVDLKIRPRWGIAFATIVLVSVVVSYFTMPLNRQIAFVTLTRSLKMPHGLAERTIASSMGMQLIGIALIPLVSMVRLVFVLCSCT